MRTAVKMRGKFHVEHFRNGQRIGVYDFKNGIVNVGLDAILDIMFHDATKISTWFLGLVDEDTFTAYAAADTMGSHAGWDELTIYDEVTRPEWTEGAAASQAITNSTPVTFTMNNAGSVRGIFLTSNNTISGTTGTLWATADFAAPVSVIAADELKVTYTIEAASA